MLTSFSLRTRALTERRSAFAQSFGAQTGNLHVLREGALDVLHPPQRPSDLPARLRVDEPTLLLYLSPVEHVLSPIGAATTTCAQIELAGGAAHPLAQALPSLVAVPVHAVQGLEPALALLCAEVDHVQCGHRVLADRLFEVVLVQLLRWIVQHPERAGVRPGLIAGLADARLAPVLVAVHERPAERWTLASMAALAGMSRSAFSEHFRTVMGRSPAAYVGDWRVALAQDQLRSGAPVNAVARELGYGDASTFTRAFASRVGATPRAWLRAVG